MKKFKFLSAIAAGLLLTCTPALNAHSGGGGGGGDSRNTFTSTSSLTGLDQIYVSNMDFESVGGSQVSGGTVEIITEPLTPEQIQRQEIEQQMWEGELGNAFWSAVSSLMNAGEATCNVLIVTGGMAVGVIAAEGVVVYTTAAGVTYVLTAAGSAAAGSAYTVVTSLIKGDKPSDAAASGVRTFTVSMTVPGGPVVQGLVDAYGPTTADVRNALPEVAPSSNTSKTPTSGYHSPNYNGVTVTPTGQPLYH